MQPRPGLRALHQLPADAPGVRTGLIRPRISHAAARHRAEDRAARGIPLDAPRGALRDFLLLAAENMAKYIYDEVSAGLKTKEGVRVASVRLWETDTASATYFP